MSISPIPRPPAVQPVLSQIWIYPIKSLDPLCRSQVNITTGGTLQDDRRWAIRDQQGRWINAKREPRIHLIRCQFHLDGAKGADQITHATLAAPGQTTERFSLLDDRPQLEEWLSDYFGQSVQLVEDQNQGFPDDTHSPGPTIVTEATLVAVSEWLGLSVENVRQRFRANLELTLDPTPDHPDLAFWEDCLFGSPLEKWAFSLGEVDFQGVNPCLRCVVPTRDPQTGTVYPQFVRQFSQKRRATLPPWVNPDRFENPYRLTVNTRISPTSRGKTLHLGNMLSLNF